jgi:hypothetical protein
VTAHHSPVSHLADGGVAAVTAVHVTRALVDADTDLEHARLDRDHLEDVGAIGRLHHRVEPATDLSPATWRLGLVHRLRPHRPAPDDR